MCRPPPLQEGGSGTDWVPSYARKLPKNTRLFDSGDALFRSQPACRMAAACPDGSNCEPVHVSVDGQETLFFRVLGALDPGKDTRRAVRPGELLLWDYTADLGEEEGHIVCRRCAQERKLAKSRAEAAVKEGREGKLGAKAKADLEVALAALSRQPGCCSACFCRK